MMTRRIVAVWAAVLAVLFAGSVPASAGGTVAAVQVQAGPVIAFKVCEHAGALGRCLTVYKQPNGKNFYNLNELSGWAADNASSVIVYETGKRAVTLYRENAWGFGWGTECGREWRENAMWYIGNACNDDLGAVLLS